MYIVVGGEISGTIMAARIVEAGESVLLFDAQLPYTASKVAAGMFNTVTGKRAALTWQAELLSKELFDFIGEDPHLHRQAVIRPFHNVEALNNWTGFSADYPHIIKVHHELEDKRIHAPYGAMEMLNTGWLDVPAYVSALQDKLRQTGRFTYYPELLPYGAIHPDYISFAGEQPPYKAIVFAEGHRVNDNPWWPCKFPVHPLKGELLEVELAGPNTDYTYVNKVYLAGLGNGRYRCGSTYELTYNTHGPTEAGRAEIMDYLTNRLLASGQNPTVVNHLSGLRPTTPDRRPMLGKHRELPYYFLNGMGTKGVLQAPWCSKVLWEYMQGTRSTLPAEIDLYRWTK